MIFFNLYKMINILIYIKFIIIIIIFIINIMCINIKEYRLYVIMCIISIIYIINWPINIIEINYSIMNIVLGYNINIHFNNINIYFNVIIDILILISIIYEYYYININNIMNIFIYFIINLIFFNNNDIIMISIIYEFQTIPLLFIINNYNNINIYNKKAIGYTNLLLILYSIISGILLFFSFNIIYIYYYVLNIYYIIQYNNNIEIIIYIIILISGGIKLSVFPFNIWLSKVHVEAPTIGSILLAGISLKTGFYLHLLFFFYFLYINEFIIYIIIIILCIGIIIYNINIFYQVDTKRWIALYSIIHMNLYYFIFFNIIFYIYNINNLFFIIIIIIIIYGMIGHSFISSGLFLLIGYIYDFTNNKNLFLINTNIISHFIFFSIFILLIFNSSFPFSMLFIFEFFSYIYISFFNFFNTYFTVSFSSFNILSSLFIFHKYFNTNNFSFISFNIFYDFIIFFLLFPLFTILFLCGINCLIPITYVSLFKKSIFNFYKDRLLEYNYYVYVLNDILSIPDLHPSIRASIEELLSQVIRDRQFFIDNFKR